MSKTQKAKTIHGDVQYETVDCSSCGEEVAKEQACFFAIGEVKGRRRSRNRVSFKNGYITGWACPYCADGPVGFPEPGSARERFMMWFYSLSNDERAFFLVGLFLVIAFCVSLAGIPLTK